MELNQPSAYYDDTLTFDPDSTGKLVLLHNSQLYGDCNIFFSDPIYVNEKLYYLNQVYSHVFPPYQKPAVSNYRESWWLTLVSCVGAAAGIIVAGYGIGFLAWWLIYVDLYLGTWRMTTEEFEEFMWKNLDIPPPSEKVPDEYSGTTSPEDIEEDAIHPPSDDEY